MFRSRIGDKRRLSATFGDSRRRSATVGMYTRGRGPKKVHLSASILVTILACTLLLPSGWGRPQVPCRFSTPATDAVGSCDVYDLSTVAEMGAKSFSTAHNSYVFSLCENVPSSAVPAPCKNASQSVAYQLPNNSKTCYIQYWKP